MKICVCLKYVPDPNFPMRVDPATRRLERDPAHSLLDPGNEYAVEAALKLVEAHGGETVAVCMGPDTAAEAVRRAMAMGVDRAILITDPALAGSDALTTARVLAAAIKPEAPDLVICSTESTDAYSGMVPGALAENLDVPQLTFAREITLEGATVTVHQDTETGYRVVRADLPALVTVTASIGEPRYPSVRGLMSARRKPIDERDLAALGLEPQSVGEHGAKEHVIALDKVMQDKQTQMITDDGSGSSVDEIVQFLKNIHVV